MCRYIGCWQIQYRSQDPNNSSDSETIRVPRGSLQGTLWTLLASWFRDHQTHLLALSSSATRTCPGKRERENAGKIIGELWEIPPADLENQDTLPFCKKVRVGADHSKFVCKILHNAKCVFLRFVAPSPKFGFLAVACGCRAPLVVALRNRRYSRNGCHHIIAHVPPVSTLLKASHKMQPNCVQRKREQQIFSYRFADHKGKTAFMEREENYQEWFAVMISHSCSMQMVIQSVPLFHQYVTTTNWQQKPGWKIFTLSA